MNLFADDCLHCLTKMRDESVDLVYLDPPFFSQREHRSLGRNDRLELSFSDKWSSLDEYLLFLTPRIRECHRVLKPTGSIFLHCDKFASHHLRVLLDDIFGGMNFINEIIWTYKRWSNSKNGLQNTHQNIYFYSKTGNYTFNSIFTEYSPTTNIDQILQERVRGDDGKSAYKRDEHGNPVICRGKKGVPIGDVWNIPFLNPKARERVGYPTQKPILLLERIIRIGTNEGDVVLDPFCGSGSTMVAARLLNRKYIGIDISPDAINIARQRLEEPCKTTSKLFEKGEREYINKSDDEMNMLKAIDAVPVQRNSGIDGFMKGTINGKPVPVKIQKSDESVFEALSKLRKAADSRNCRHMVLLKTQEDRIFFDAIENDDNILIVTCHRQLIENWISRCNDSQKRFKEQS